MRIEKSSDDLRVWKVIDTGSAVALINQPLKAIADQNVHVGDHIYRPPKMLARSYHGIRMTTVNASGEYLDTGEKTHGRFLGGNIIAPCRLWPALGFAFSLSSSAISLEDVLEILRGIRRGLVE